MQRKLLHDAGLRAAMSTRRSNSAAVIFFSDSSAILARMSASSLATSLRPSWMICNSISEIVPRACALVALSRPRSIELLSSTRRGSPKTDRRRVRVPARPLALPGDC
jgi:hypothetical protein